MSRLIFRNAFFIAAIVVCTGFSLPAFPGAEGFGSETRGGRGGTVIAVTNINDSGPGSLRAAVAARGPRIVVFRVAGTILLKSRIEINEPFLTIAGQTAPGDGITISKVATHGKGLFGVNTHDVVLRYLRLRNLPVDTGSGQVDALTARPECYNLVVDHCSFSWATDEVFQTEGSSNLTIQWCIISEGLSYSSHLEGEHSKGLFFRGDSSDNISAHHNLLAHNMTRNPSINTTGIVDMVNNVIYNGGYFWTLLRNSFGAPNVNAINNYYKKGPSSLTQPQRFGHTKNQTYIYIRRCVHGTEETKAV